MNGSAGHSRGPASLPQRPPAHQPPLSAPKRPISLPAPAGGPSARMRSAPAVAGAGSCQLVAGRGAGVQAISPAWRVQA